MPSKPEISFVLRNDAYIKPGGDTAKVDRYRESLTKMGVQTEVLTTTKELVRSHSPIVHLVNLDLPLENLRFARAARENGKKVVLSTVSHPYDGLVAMYRFSDDFFFSRLRSLGISAETGLVTREAMKLLRRRQFAIHRSRAGVTGAQQALLDLCHAGLPMAEGEMSQLQDRFETPRLRLVRNGLNFTVDSNPLGREGIIVVGRVEPRKNTLELAMALSGGPHKVSFCGSINPRHRRYATAFLALVRRSRNLNYLGQLAKPQLRDELRKHKFYFNASWCEVVSQADLEAASLGCQVVSTKHSYLRDFISGGYQVLDPAVIAGPAAEAYVLHLLESQVMPGSIRNDSWDDAAVRLVEVYEEVS